MDAVRKPLLPPSIHKKFEMSNGEATIAGLKVLAKLHHDPHFRMANQSSITPRPSSGLN